MQDIGIGDVIFILLVLGLIHGIMTWVTRNRRPRQDKSSDSSNSEV